MLLEEAPKAQAVVTGQSQPSGARDDQHLCLAGTFEWLAADRHHVDLEQV